MTTLETPCDDPPAELPKPQRLVSLDAYRGAIMLMMASAGLGAAQIARQYPEMVFPQFRRRGTREPVQLSSQTVLQPGQAMGLLAAVRASLQVCHHLLVGLVIYVSQ